MGFKEDFAKFDKPGKERENFVYNAIISNISREQIVNSMKPITVVRPDGAKLIYKVMPDYLSIQGIRVPLSGSTAQRIADHFGLSLPTAQMSREIYNNSDVKMSAKPLSGTGTTVDGVHYSGTDVVNKGVGYAPFAINYNEKINNELQQKGVKPGEIVSGFAKDIVAPPAGSKTLGLHGFYDANGNPIQGGNGQTPHDTEIHTEYGAFARLVSPTVTIEYPDGRKETKPISSDKYSQSTPPVKTETKIYPAKPDTLKSKEPSKKSPTTEPKLDIWQSIDNFLKGFDLTSSTKINGRMQILKRILKG